MYFLTNKFIIYLKVNKILMMKNFPSIYKILIKKLKKSSLKNLYKITTLLKRIKNLQEVKIKK